MDEIVVAKSRSRKRIKGQSGNVAFDRIRQSNQFGMCEKAGSAGLAKPDVGRPNFNTLRQLLTDSHLDVNAERLPRPHSNLRFGGKVAVGGGYQLIFSGCQAQELEAAIGARHAMLLDT